MGEEPFKRQLYITWAASQYAANLCCRQPALFKAMVESGRLERPSSQAEVADLLSSQLDYELALESDHHELSEESFDSQLRQFRNAELLRIIWRDLNRLAELVETTADISALAEACISQALDFHHHRLAQRFGEPMAEVDGELKPQRMVVLAMGKLGAWELNLSSDIDLIFCYPHRGQTQNTPIDNGDFFTRLARKLIHSLDNVTEDGFVFRVDMRLRPYGQSGALVLSFSAMEEYYQDQGRDWERYALIKARPITGEPAEGDDIMQRLRPLIYRRYVDFSAFEALRSMKQMIRQEVQRRNLDEDVKLGAGGIREIEFIAQCFQLIRGGREPQLQERQVLKALVLLAEKQCMPEEVSETLRFAYVFLRNSEHAIQAYNDQQVHSLPKEQAGPVSPSLGDGL